MKVRRVLIIDDEPNILELLELKFEREGLEVLTANSAEDGLRKAYEHRPDLIILDIAISDGEEQLLSERLKADERTALIPLILLSARTDKGVDSVGDEWGLTRLRKPFRPSQLLALAREHL